MSSKDHSQRLFLVVLGGKSRHCHIEQHDIRWVSGKTIEDTFPQLRKEWYADQRGLHIDSYIAINNIDGYDINLENSPESKKRDYNSKNNENLLWFVNLGGYNSDRLYELHEVDLVVATSRKLAIKISKGRTLHNVDQRHKDDVYCINEFDTVDNCYSINEVNGLKVSLIKNPNNIPQKLVPDWYGYLRIDTHAQLELY